MSIALDMTTRLADRARLQLSLVVAAAIACAVVSAKILPATMDAISEFPLPICAADASSGSSQNKVEIVTSHALPDMPGKRVTVVDYPDGRLSIRYRGVELAYRTFDKIRQVDQGAIADNKRLGPLLAMIRDQQRRCEPGHRSQRAPRRRDQRDARLFKVG